MSIQALASRKVLYQGKGEDGVYPIYPHKASQLHLSSKVCNHVSKVCNTVSRSVGFNKTLWHMRLGHPHDQVLKYVFPNDRSIINKCTNLVQTCTHCLYGKMHNLPFPKSQFVASSPFELVHSNVWGPAPITSVNGFHYYVIFVDHFTQFTLLYPLKSKFEVFSKFLLFKALIETQFSTKIKTFRSDGGGEYTSTAFKSFLSQHGIINQISCPYTPQ